MSRLARVQEKVGVFVYFSLSSMTFVKPRSSPLMYFVYSHGARCHWLLYLPRTPYDTAEARDISLSCSATCRSSLFIYGE